jgi:hypothetical protein
MSGRDIDLVMNVFAPWTAVRWGELMAVEGSERKDSPLQVPDDGRATYALDWQLLELGGKATKGRFLPGTRPTAVPRRPDALGDQ